MQSNPTQTSYFCYLFKSAPQTKTGLMLANMLLLDAVVCLSEAALPLDLREAVKNILTSIIEEKE